MTGVERTHHAAMTALRRNFSILSINLRDMTSALAFLEERRKAGEKLTFAALLIKAVGVALAKYPRLGWMRRGRKIVKPSTADVGCSVGTRSPVSPVVVVRDAGKKSLTQINDELGRLVAEARAKEDAELARIDRLARLMPFDWLFRLILRVVTGYQRFLRTEVGNFQITIPKHANIDFGATANTAVTTVMLGRIKDRPFVEDGKLVVRPTVYFCIHFDHALHGAEHGIEFVDEMYRLMDHPEELL
jgi:pyruvate dehydrogenase E2 component (dihydrolipoamide acetyltransferase)